MTPFLLYMARASLYLAIFYAFYLLVMRRTSLLRFNRSALLLGTALCHLLPLMRLRTVVLPAAAPVADPAGQAVPFQQVEQKPTFQGGDAATFAKWMSVRLKYPEEAKNAGIQGRVMVKFTVCEDGTVRDARVLQGINPMLDAEALRVISTSQKWEPGAQEGKPVKVTYQFPVIFVRQGEEVTVSDAHGVSQEDGQEVHSYLSVSHKKKQFLFVRSSDVPATSGSPSQRRTDYQQLTD